MKKTILMLVVFLLGLTSIASADVLEIKRNASHHAVEDGYLNSGASDLDDNFGDFGNPRLGADSLAILGRGMFAFNVTLIPASAIITRVIMNVTFGGCPSSFYEGNSMDLNLYKFIEKWYEGVENNAVPSVFEGSTWNERKAIGNVAWSGGAGAFGSETVMNTTTSGTVGPLAQANGLSFHFDSDDNSRLLSDVIGWYNSSDINYGWLLKENEDTTDNRGSIHTSECWNKTGAISNTSIPTLIVYYNISVPDTTPPVISNLYDVTGAGTNETSDTTPTINLTTDESAGCNISTDNSTWFDFTTSGTTNHQGTIDASDPLEIGYPQNVSVNCTDTSSNSAYATIVYNITDGQTPNVDLNEPADNTEFGLGINNTLVINFTATDNYFSTLNCNLTFDGILNQTNVSVVSGQETLWASTTFGVGNYNPNVSCIDGHGNYNSSQRNFSVVALPDCVVSGIILYLDGLNQSRKYEYGSSVNISANLTYTSIVGCNPVNIHIDLDAPNYGVDSSVGINKTDFLYNITILRQNKFSDGSTSKTLPFSELCYQETANDSSITSTHPTVANGDCDLIFTGNLNVIGNWNSPENVTDGDWSTYGRQTPPTTSKIYVNYTKPQGAFSSNLWTIKDSGGTFNLTIPSSCWEYSTTTLSLWIQSWDGNKAVWYCVNSTQDVLLRNHIEDARIYEEAMRWNISTKTVTINMDNRTDLIEGSVNISGTNNISDIVITNEGVIIAVLPDYLNNTDLTHKSFIYSGVKFNSTNITYLTASTETIFINMSGSGSEFFNITFQLNGFNIDEGNEADYMDNFTNESIYFNNSNISVFGFYDNMEDENVNAWWEFTAVDSSLANCNMTTGNTDDYLNHVLPSGQFGYGSASCVSTNEGDDNFGLKNLSEIKMMGQWRHHATKWSESASCSSNGYSQITDGTNTVNVYTLFSGSRSTSIIRNFNLTMTKIEQDSWSYYYIKDDGESSSGIIDLSSLDENQNWYFKFLISQTASTVERDCAMNNWILVYDIKQNGLSLNRTYTNRSYEANHSFIVSDVVVNTPSNVTAAWLFVSEYVPDNTNTYYYLSADNGTTWKSIVPNLRNVFNTWGNQSIFRANLTTGNINLSPVVYSVRLRVIPATITDIEIDAGDDGDTDWNQSGVLNSTTSPWNVTISSDEPFDYADDYNSNEIFLFPVSISTGSEGLLQVSSLESKQNPNPIILNVSVLEDCYLCKLGATFTGGTLNFTSLALDFLGSWNYTALAHTPDYSKNASHLIMVKHSKFNCTLPQEVDYYEPFPIMSNDDKNVTPYGQEINYCNTTVDNYCSSTSTPIFNCTYLGYDEPIANFSVSVNQTQNGIDLWFNDNVTKIGAINITTTEQHIFQLNKTNSTGVWGWNDFWNASLTSIYSYYPEINFTAYCSECEH